MKDYVREYFDRHAERWVEAAYAGETRFPIGPERVRLALTGVSPALREGAVLVDLGCGGGQLCLDAAELGWRVLGVDVAPAMIEEARELCAGRNVELVGAPFDENGLPDESSDAVTAMGLIEYLPDDDALFAEARRLLRPGGRFAVSCRNRLYNLQSVNAYTARELESGDGSALLEELQELLEQSTAYDLYTLADELAKAADDLEEAGLRDAEEPRERLFHHPSTFAEDRRQHTPRELLRSGERHGFRVAAVLPLHPHPLPPRLEELSPRAYNRLALAWQRGLDGSLVGLAFCSAFVAVFEQ